MVASLLIVGTLGLALEAEPYRKGDLLLYYPFEEGGGDIAMDASGNLRDGQVIGAPNWVEGRFGQAIDLDTGNSLGSNDASGQHVLAPSFVIGPSATFSFWINRDSQPNWARFIDFSNGPNLANILIAPVGTTNNLDIGFRDTNVGDRNFNVANLVENAKWAHFAVVFDDRGTNSSHIRVYKDGLLRGTKTDASPIPAIARKNQYIGRSAWNDRYADFKLDDFRIYGVALADPEIALIHQGGDNGEVIDSPPEFVLVGDSVITLNLGDEFTEPGVVAADAEDGTLDVTSVTIDVVTRDDDMLGHWRFDDGTSNDSSGNGHNGVHSADDIYNDDSPFEGGKGINLADNKYVTVSDGASQGTFDGGSGFSVSIWVKGWPNGDWLPFISKRGEGGQGWQLRRRGADTDQIAFTMRGPGNDDWAVQKNINDEKWHHLVGTFGEGKRVLYVDGVLAGEEDRGGAVTPTGSQLVFGARDNSADPSNPPNIGNQSSVALDDIRFYRATLDAGDVTAIYNEGNGDFLGPLDTSKIGTWKILYSATDSAGHSVTAHRIIKVVDPQAPVIALVGEVEVTHEAGPDFVDPSATVADATGGALDATAIIVAGSVDSKVPGAYKLTYDFTDAEGRAASTIRRTVTVVDTAAPVITMVGEETIRHRPGNPFRDPGVNAEDAADGTLIVDSSEFTWNQLSVNGYELSGRDDTWVNLDFNGGLLEQTPKGSAVFKGGPLGVGINIETDAMFHDLNVGITKPDDFQILIHGVFRPRT
ncbi:MAG: DUF5011 domain-containing protein, partial [Opitutae bacterium]|nr:DUF5011 domain-containing protein [Opitutae bacterium]